VLLEFWIGGVPPTQAKDIAQAIAMAKGHEE
jgi:hypothetical protein